MMTPWSNDDDATETPNNATITVNGRILPAAIGDMFARAVSAAAREAGFTGKWNVRMARPGEPFETVTREDAPTLIEAGMRIEITPHTVGA